MNSRKIADDLPVTAHHAGPGQDRNPVLGGHFKGEPVDETGPHRVDETGPHRRAACSPSRPAGPAAAVSERRRSRLPAPPPPRPPRSELGVPVAFGYVRVPPSWPSVVGAERVRTLEAAAHRCGWVL